MIRSTTVVLVLALATPLPLLADDAHHKRTTNVAQAADSLVEGEVRKVDKEAKKLTIRHAPLTNLDMPAMTMVFQVEDPSMLDQVKVGDKIRFEADKVGGAYTVKRLEPAK
jgi:Cu/Ag efflux protein CusF